MRAMVLSGGGARGAYQAGVLKGLAEIFGSERLPVEVLSGVSAGAINAAYLAARADRFSAATASLAGLWRGLTSDQVFRTDPWSVFRIALRLVGQVALHLHGETKGQNLLDTAPLRRLLQESIPFDAITGHVEARRLDALTIAALDYGTGESVTFFQSSESFEGWRRVRRRATHTQIQCAHVLASSALPLFFPAVRIGDRFFGDGALRNVAPLSAPIRLGADGLLIIGVRKHRPDSPIGIGENPTFGRILGVMLNAVLMDNIERDLELLERINESIAAGITVPPESQKRFWWPIKTLYLRPSRDLGKLALDHVRDLPLILRYLLGGLGRTSRSSELLSYFTFEPEYTGQLIELGFADAMAAQDEIRDFLAEDAG